MFLRQRASGAGDNVSTEALAPDGIMSASRSSSEAGLQRYSASPGIGIARHDGMLKAFLEDGLCGEIFSARVGEPVSNCGARRKFARYLICDREGLPKQYIERQSNMD